MNGLWLCLTLVGVTPCEPGTLLFLENSNKIVEGFTAARVSHVAVVVNDGDQPYVYEAAPPKVRSVPLVDYYAEIAAANQGRKEEDQMRLWLLEPTNPYSPQELADMKTYLDGQLGRRYSIRNYVRSKPGDGIHCAELASTAMSQSGRYHFHDCHEITPQALVQAVSDDHRAPVAAELPEPPIESWCSRSWKSWTSFGSWCSWSCWETWTFCW